MNLEQIREFLHGHRPFTLRMVSGRQYHVKHPDYAAISQNHTILVFFDEKSHAEYIRLN